MKDAAVRVLSAGDPSTWRSVSEALPEVTICPTTDALNALHVVSRERFDAALLAVSLPDGDGRELCRTLRRSGFAGPILLLADFADDLDMSGGFDAGASDYLVQPCKTREISTRVRAQLRRGRPDRHAALRVGQQLLRPGESVLSQPDCANPVQLTGKEAAILRRLHQADGATVTYDELLRDVWGYNPTVETNTVQTHVSRLRRKVEPHADSPRLLLRGGGLLRDGGGWRLARPGAAAPGPGMVVNLGGPVPPAR